MRIYLASSFKNPNLKQCREALVKAGYSVFDFTEDVADSHGNIYSDPKDWITWRPEKIRKFLTNDKTAQHVFNAT